MKSVDIRLRVDIAEGGELPDETVARVFYPDEGGRIILQRGLTRAEVDRALLHEIGHVVDWYMSSGAQAPSGPEREAAADSVADALSVARVPS